MEQAVYDAKTDESKSVNLYHYLLSRPTGDAQYVPREKMHFHNAVELVVIESGRYRAWVNEKPVTLSRGDVLFVQRGEAHRYENLSASLAHCLNVPQELFESLHLPRKLPMVIRGDSKSNRLSRIFHEAHRRWDSASEQYKIGFVYTVFGVILQSFPLENLDKDKNTDKFTEILKYLEEHFREQISLDDLTERFGYSKSYFSRTFNRLTGMNLREFLNRRRITEALKMKAEHPSVPWVHISVNVGFESWSTFARAYKRYGGNDLTE